MPELKLEVGGKLPGEDLMKTIFEWDMKYRDTMSQENRNEQDRIKLAMLRGWHNAWVAMGWPGEKV